MTTTAKACPGCLSVTPYVHSIRIRDASGTLLSFVECERCGVRGGQVRLSPAHAVTLPTGVDMPAWMKEKAVEEWNKLPRFDPMKGMACILIPARLVPNLQDMVQAVVERPNYPMKAETLTRAPQIAAYVNNPVTVGDEP